jgi:hypothetical protein
MNSYLSSCSSLRQRSARHSFMPRSYWIIAVFVLSGMITSLPAAAASERHDRVSGAGKTIIEGGTGGTAPIPVTTLVAFHADGSGGDFECLAFAPSKATGRESGEFDTNVMYVTGKVTSVVIDDDEATLRGTATVTGLGAGQNVPFTVTVRGGGPGATVNLTVAGLTFKEILVEGHISIDRHREE